jgi:hypothetical protein
MMMMIIIIIQYLPGENEENHEKPQSEQPVSGPRF